jgi:oligoribonuclease NrnB/cAMP/cGMP phosphodiesterase (DHH superfamily)
LYYYHLSHIDLDGYSAQVVADCFVENISFYNSNYGEEILVRINQIFDDIKTQNIDEEILLLITDVNLTLEQCAYIEEKVYDVDNMQVLVLDHHISGIESSNAYEWYYLDDSRCATKITYDYFIKNHCLLNTQDKSWLSTFVDAVNAVDIWLEEDELFEFGKVCMQMINRASEIPKDMFAKYDVRYKHYLIKEASKYINKENAPILLDEDIYFIKKKYLNIGEENDTFDNIVSEYILKLLEENQDLYTICYQDKKAIVSFKLSHISILANHFLKSHGEIDFFINVSAKGYVSLRSNNQADVSKISSRHFNGGGHKNASGGSIKGFKNSFEYTKIKKQIINILN